MKLIKIILILLTLLLIFSEYNISQNDESIFSNYTPEGIDVDTNFFDMSIDYESYSKETEQKLTILAIDQVAVIFEVINNKGDILSATGEVSTLNLFHLQNSESDDFDLDTNDLFAVTVYTTYTNHCKYELSINEEIGFCRFTVIENDCCISYFESTIFNLIKMD